MTTKKQETSQKLSFLLENASSVIRIAVWLTVSFLFTSIALMLLLVFVILVIALNIWDNYFRLVKLAVTSLADALLNSGNFRGHSTK
jgi:uncharacterized membrane protein YqjE